MTKEEKIRRFMAMSEESQHTRAAMTNLIEANKDVILEGVNRARTPNTAEICRRVASYVDDLVKPSMPHVLSACERIFLESFTEEEVDSLIAFFDDERWRMFRERMTEVTPRVLEEIDHWNMHVVERAMAFAQGALSEET